MYSSLDMSDAIEWREVVLSKSNLKIFNIWSKSIKGFYHYMVEIPFLQFLETNT